MITPDPYQAGGQERYYAHKFPQLGDATARAAVALAFAEGLCWVMRYYYDGCRSWQWFYPYHYAPFAADIASAIDPAQPFPLKLGAPFLPFQQLMGVLPPRSAHALPAPLAELMCDTTSPIALTLTPTLTLTQPQPQPEPEAKP